MLAVTLVLLPIAGVFQIFAGLQAVLAGVLRGAGETHAAMQANLIGFWLVGIPISLLAGFRWGGGPAGLWWGLVAGLVAVSALLGWRALHRLGGRQVAMTGGPAAQSVSEA